MNKVPSEKFENIDGLRFLAATIVFFGHGIRPSLQFLDIRSPFVLKLLNLFMNGGLAVSLFFVLSGFLITLNLTREYRDNGKINLFHFYWRRALRIWPLYFVILCFGLILYPLWNSFASQQYISCYNPINYVFFLGNFDIIRTQSVGCITPLFLDITWSVSVEEQFYIIWALLFKGIPRKYWSVILFVSLTGGIVFCIAHSQNQFFLYYHPLSCLVDLSTGGAIAYLIQSRERIYELVLAIKPHQFWILILLFLSFFLFEGYLFNFTGGYALRRFLVAFLLALFISILAFSYFANSISSNPFIKRVNGFGKYSYGIYLIHPVVLFIFFGGINYLGYIPSGFFTSILIGMFAYLLTLILSKLSFLYFEVKFITLRDFFITGNTRVES